MIRAAIYGLGNIGRYVFEAITSCEDIKLIGIVSQSYREKQFNGYPVVKNIQDLADVQVAILCSGSMDTPDIAETLLSQGICTVDSFDIHSEITEVRKRLAKAAKANNTAAVIAAGWDPGSDSVIRALFEAMAPRGLTYTNFGPGMSMGHSVAAKTIPGVKEALSMTIPLGTSVHRRNVYIELEAGADANTVANAIKSHKYFCHDETHVIPVNDVNAIRDMGHGVDLTRKGISGTTHNQNFQFKMSINNPALTAQILVSCARAVMLRTPGCYTMIEIPPIDLLPGDREEIIGRIV